MGKLAAAINQAAHGGPDKALLAAVRVLPSRPTTPPLSDDDPGPIPGESFDDVTAAWCRGLLSDDQYDRAIAAASGEPTGG